MSMSLKAMPMTTNFGESDMVSESKLSKSPEYQYDVKKLLSLEKDVQEIMMQFIKNLTSNGDWETKQMIRNTLLSYGLIVTKRERNLNEVLG